MFFITNIVNIAGSSINGAEDFWVNM